MKVTVLAGGVGAARFLTGLIRVIDQTNITVIGNVGDDTVLHGLHISPDLDTVVYTLAEAIDPERGWGLAGETWAAMEMIKRYGGIDWFNLGDRDLGTHMYRTHRQTEGATLTDITNEIARAWELKLRILPVTNDPLRTMVTVADEGEIPFQEYFVRRQHNVAVTRVHFEGASNATPAPGVLEAIKTADRVVIAPSNPIVSIGPLLAVPGVTETLATRRDDTVAISPIIGDHALKGPADRMLKELGHESSVVGVARLYSHVAGTLIIDNADRDRIKDIEEAGLTPIVTSTIMSTPEIAVALAECALHLNTAPTNASNTPNEKGQR